MLSFLKDFESKLGIKITCSQETEPLGTAGPLALARDKLIDGSGEPFFVLNSDVISEYPFGELIKFHKTHGGEATIMVTKVNSCFLYGFVFFLVLLHVGSCNYGRLCKYPFNFGICAHAVCFPARVYLQKQFLDAYPGRSINASKHCFTDAHILSLQSYLHSLAYVQGLFMQKEHFCLFVFSISISSVTLLLNRSMSHPSMVL